MRPFGFDPQDSRRLSGLPDWTDRGLAEDIEPFVQGAYDAGFEAGVTEAQAQIVDALTSIREGEIR